MDLEKAAQFIREGKLVAFPTETVYGLGGDAFDREAVAKIYAAKGRPGDNPLILHVADADGFTKLAHNPPEYAYALIKSFWAGPLTLVARKKPDLPHWLGGHPDGETDTIGIRMPEHPVAQALIKASDRVLAAPSANKAGKPSPTTATHVLEDFPIPEDEGIMVLDGGSVSVGLESTVVDTTGDFPKILRPGAVTAQMISDATGLYVHDFDGGKEATGNKPVRSPGMKYRHYAPNAPMTILAGSPENIAAYIMKEYEQTHGNIGLLLPMETTSYFSKMPEMPKLKVINISSSLTDSKDIAKNLFSSLRRFDKIGVSVIFAQAVPNTGLGTAIMDRMTKAAEGRVLHV